MTDTTGDHNGAELVLGLMAPAPSAPFVISRIDEDGKRHDTKLRIKYLRAAEDIAALEDAQAYAKKHKEVGKEYGDIYREAQAHELLARALCKPEPYKNPDGTTYYGRYFVDSEQLRNALGSNEIALALNAYEIVKAKFSCIESWSPEEIDKWAARLADTALGPFFLSRLDSSHWPALLLSLAQEVQALRASLGQPLPSWQDFSESAPATSESGTGGSTESSSASLSGLPGEIPSNTLLSREQARALVKERRGNSE